MTYTFTGSLASDSPFWGSSEIPWQKYNLGRRETPRAAIISMPFLKLTLRITHQGTR